MVAMQPYVPGLWSQSVGAAVSRAMRRPKEPKGKNPAAVLAAVSLHMASAASHEGSSRSLFHAGVLYRSLNRPLDENSARLNDGARLLRAIGIARSHNKHSRTKCRPHDRGGALKNSNLVYQLQKARTTSSKVVLDDSDEQYLC